MSEIRVLNELGLEFERVTTSAPHQRSPITTRPIAVVLAVIGLAAVGGAAAAGLLPIGPTLKGPDANEVGPSLTPVPSTAQITQLRQRDPLGGDAWTLRVATTRTGGRCVAVGRIRNGVFGTSSPDGSFHPLPLLGTGTCGDLATDGAVTDVAVTRTRGGVITALGGVTDVPIAELTTRVAGRPVTGQHARRTF